MTIYVDYMVSGAILIRGKQADMLLALKDRSQEWYISGVARRSSTSYVSACNFLAECRKRGIVSVEKHGRTKGIKLTEKGLLIAEHLERIRTLLEEAETAKPKEK